MMAMGQLVLGVRARARECFEVRVGCTKRAEVTGGVGTPVRPSYDTSGNSYLPHGPRAGPSPVPCLSNVGGGALA